MSTTEYIQIIIGIGQIIAVAIIPIIVWVLGIILTVFVGVVSLEGSLTSSIDGVTAKTAKAAVSSLIPIVR